MKKSISILLVLAMLAALLTGCGAKSQEAKSEGDGTVTLCLRILPRRKRLSSS